MSNPANKKSSQLPAEVYVFDGHSSWVSVSPHVDPDAPPAPHRHPASEIDGLSTVATTNDYRDLDNLPVIPPQQVQSDWTATGGFAYILNKPTNLSQFNNGPGFVTAQESVALAPVKSLIAGPNVGISNDGRGNYTIAASGSGGGGGTVISVSGVYPIVVTDGTTAAVVSISPATVDEQGSVRLADDTAIANGTAGRVIDAAQFKASMGSYLPLAGGQMTGDITWDTGAKIGDPAANTFAISTAGVERLRVGSDGQVTVVPDAARLNLGNGGSLRALAAGILGFYSGTSLAMTIETTRINGYKSFNGAVPDIGGCFVVPNPPASATRTGGYGFQSNVNTQAGETRYAIFCAGSAPSYFNGQLFVSGGSATIPSLASLGSTATGLYFPAADTVAISTAGVERFRVKTTGAVRYIPLAAAPTPTEEGDVYYDSTLKKLRVYNGTAWVDLH